MGKKVIKDHFYTSYSKKLNNFWVLASTFITEIIVGKTTTLRGWKIVS